MPPSWKDLGSHEMPNILNMMDLGIPSWPKTGPEDPFVCAGGPCVFNSEPLADFLDFCMLGDGGKDHCGSDPAYRAWKSEGKPGERAPVTRGSTYRYEIHADGTRRHQYRERSILRNRISTILIFRPIQLFLMETRFMTGSCWNSSAAVPRRRRFCNAGIPSNDLMELARELVPATGYNEMSMFSLSTADYSQLDPWYGIFLEEFKG